MGGFTSCHTHFQLREGDLLFHVVDEGEGNAITAVTPGGIDHVAIYIGSSGVQKFGSSCVPAVASDQRSSAGVQKFGSSGDVTGWVVEAVGSGVVMTQMDSLLHRDGGYYLAGRVRGIDRRRSVSNALSYLGRPYDDLYLADNEAVYCSELVQLSFVDRRGERVFEPVPMSFHDSTGVVTPYWREFYSRQGMEVPEGKPGTNPGELSRRKRVRLHLLR